MDPTHTAELIERHEVAIPIPYDQVDWSGAAGACATYKTQREFARATAWSSCRKIALDWLTERGLDAEVRPFETTSADGGDARWGVEFTIVVGRGATKPPMDTDSPREAPELHNWNWSARWQYWSAYFAGMTGPGAAVEIETAERAVVRLAHAHALAEGYADGSVIDIEDVRERHARRHGMIQTVPGIPITGTMTDQMRTSLDSFNEGGWLD